MLAKLFSLFFLLMPVCLVQAQESTEYVNAFGGVDNYQDSSKIAKTDAQDAMNVLTDTGKLMKRPGSVALNTLLDGQPVYTLGEYISPSNIRYLIAQASSTVYASDLGPTGFVAIATVTANYALDFASAFGKVYFTNGIDTPFSWDGTTTVWISSIPKCAQLEFADERLYCSNAPNFRSTLYASRFGDATDWTIPAIHPLPADTPNSFTFNRNDGDQILCSKVTPWGKFVGKKNSSYVLKGQDNDRYWKLLISPTVGCLDDRSVQMVDGELVWLGQDSTVYSWNGSDAPKPISREIDSYVKSIRQATAQQNNYNTSTLYDWSAGTVTWNGTRPGLDVETWPGDVRPSTWSHTNDDYEDWILGTLYNTTTSYADNNGSVSLTPDISSRTYDTFTDLSRWTFGAGTNYFSASLGNLRYITPTYGFYSGEIYTSTKTLGWGDWQFNVLLGEARINGDFWGNELWYYFISDSSGTLNSNSNPTLNGYVLHYKLQSSWNRVLELQKVSNGYGALMGSSTTVVIPIYTGQYYYKDDSEVKINVSSSGVFTISENGINKIIATDSSFSKNPSSFNIFKVYGTGYMPQSGFSGTDAGIDNLYIPGTFPSSGTFTSPIFDTTFSTPVGGTFSFSDTVPVGSTMAYSVRGSTASNDTAWNAWTLVSTTTSGAYRMSSVDGKRYWQYKADFSTSYSTQTPVLNDITLNAISTGTYYSKPQYIGTSITSWDLFSVDQQISNVTLSTFAIRSSNTLFGILDTLPVWTTQINGAVPTISTGSYVQFKFDLNTVTSTDTLQIAGVNVAWREGESKPLASLYDDHRYVLCANTTPGTSINDLCLVWQKNKKWIPFSGQSWGTLARFNNYPIAGDGSTGSKIWKILDTTYLNDDGAPINAYWVSKDFDYDKPNQVKVPMKIWFEADALPTSFLTVGFAPDKGNVYTSTTVDLAQAAYLNTNVSDIFDGFALGKYFKFKFSDNTLNSTFKLNAYSVYYDSKPLGQE